MSRKQWIRVITGLAVVVFFLTCSWYYSHYIDMPGFSSKAQQGRTRNALAVIVAGVVAEEAYGPSEIDLNVVKTMYPDSRITGHVNASEVRTRMELLFSSATFESQSGLEKGKVLKSEFDWEIGKTAPGKWNIGRFVLKFDHQLELTVKDGKIGGKLIRPFAFDWDINGTYDADGNVDIDISCPYGPDLKIVGKITPARKN